MKYPHYKPETWRAVFSERINAKLIAMQSRIKRHSDEAWRDRRMDDFARLSGHLGELKEMQQDLADMLLRGGADASDLLSHLRQYASEHCDDWRDRSRSHVDRMQARGRLNACREVRQWLAMISRSKTLKAAMSEVAK